MTLEMRNAMTPQEYIRYLFQETKNGKLGIDFYLLPFDNCKETDVYQVHWTIDEAEKIVQEYNRLTAALFRIGQYHEQLEQGVNPINLLTAEETEVWGTYIKPYEPFAVDWTIFEFKDISSGLRF